MRLIIHCQEKLIKLHSNWHNIRRSSNRSSEIQRERENEFILDLNNLFDIAHANTLKLIKVEDNFWLLQKEPDRKGYFAGIDKKTAKQEERLIKRAIKLDERRTKDQARRESYATFNFDADSNSEESNSCDIPS